MTIFYGFIKPNTIIRSCPQITENTKKDLMLIE
jgi:hypothetical protein